MPKIQFRSVAQSCPTLCNPIDCSMPGVPVHHQLPELTQTHVHRVSDAIQPSHPLSALLLSSIFPSIRVFSNESVLCIRWPKYWSFSFSITPSNEYSGLISLRIDWFARLNQGGKDVYHKNYITPTQGITEDTDVVCSCSGRLTMVKALSLSITWVDNIRG